MPLNLLEFRRNVVKYGGIVQLYQNITELWFNLKILVISSANILIRKRVIAQARRLHLGCGRNYKQGFCNVDYSKFADLVLDLRNPLPFKSDSIDFIYSEHMFEHLEYRFALTHLKECYRILRPGGVVRLVVPDAEKLFSAYVRRDYGFFDQINIEEKVGHAKEHVTLIDYVNYGVYQFGQHKYSYDRDKLSAFFRMAGFKTSNIKLSEFSPDLDSIARKEFSLYFSVVK